MCNGGNCLITIECFPSTCAGPLSSLPLYSLALLEAKDSFTPTYRMGRRLMGILNNQKMGLIYMGQYRWNSGKFWGTSECS